MKRGLLIVSGLIVAIAVIILLAGPYVAGGVAERTTRAGISQAQKQMKDMGVPGTLSLVEFHHGWMHSTAIVRAAFVLPDKSKTQFCIEGSVLIDHGPLVLLRDHWAEVTTQLNASGRGGACDLLKELKASPQFVAQFLDQFGNGGPIVAKSAVALDGIEDADVTVKPFKFSDEKGAIDFKALSAHSTLDKSRTHMKFNMEWGGFETHFANASGSSDLGIGKMTYQGEQTLAEGNYWLGPANMLVNDIDFQGTSAQGRDIHWHTNKLTLDSNGTEAADGARGTADVKLLQNSLNDSDMGDLSIVSSVSGLDLMEVATLRNRMNTMRYRLQAGGKSMTEAELRETFTNVQRAIEKADVKLKTIRYQLGDSTATVQADISFPGLANATFDDFKSGKSGIAKLVAIDASGKIEDSLVPEVAHATALAMIAGRKVSPQQLQNAIAILTQRMEGTLQMYSQQGLLIREPSSGDYTFTASLADGQVSVNGRPWTPGPSAPATK